MPHQQDSEDEETDADVTLGLERALRDCSGFQPYVPEDFANFESYNATLESQDVTLSSRTETKGMRCGGGDREVPRSPTTSSCTSGYFSHSASNATLSDMTFSASESSDHLSLASREPLDPPGCPSGRGCSQARSVPAGEQPQRPRTSPPVSVPEGKDGQQAGGPPHSCTLSSSQEFSDFKGAEDSAGDAGLAPFAEEWQRRNGGVDSTTDHGETLCSQKPCDVPAGVCTAASATCSEHAGGPDCVAPAVPPGATVCISVKDGNPVPEKVPPPPTGASSTAPPPGPPPRAGGEPPIQEPAQGDLPHGSPCPSPNPSSAEPSGDSSGDESAPVAQLPDWMAPGEQVWVGKRRGTVHYVGGVEFAKGIWIGVKLDMAVGECLEEKLC